jgi:hypothetical protein
VRLGLTLDYVERAPAATHWLDALRAPPRDDTTPTSYTLPDERWQSVDTAVILAGVLLVVFVLG